MKAKNCTMFELQKALDIVNEKYQGNVKFNPDSDGPSRFTLRPVDGRRQKDGSYLPGVKLSTAYCMGLSWAKKRGANSCCWHVHGDFFESLLKVQPEAVIFSAKEKIYMQDGMVVGNWQDWNIGSQMYPVYFSDCCECEG